MFVVLECEMGCLEELLNQVLCHLLNHWLNFWAILSINIELCCVMSSLFCCFEDGQNAHPIQLFFDVYCDVFTSMLACIIVPYSDHLVKGGLQR